MTSMNSKRANCTFCLVLIPLAVAACSPMSGTVSTSGSGGSTAAPAGGVSGNSVGGGTVIGPGGSAAGAATGGASGSNGAGAGGTPVVKVFPPGGPAPQVVPIRRLTVGEYTASVTDLFPGVTIPTLAFDNTADIQVLGFVNISSSQNSSAILTEQYLAAADLIAKEVTKTSNSLTGCTTVNLATPDGQVTCTQPYLKKLAERAYRRPLTDKEVEALMGLFKANQATVDYPTRFGLAIQGILVSPKFLFRPEFGATATSAASPTAPLTPWETATRLSYFVTGSLPDDALATAAGKGELATPEQIAAQTQRLLASTRSQNNVVNFHVQWLGIDRINALSKNASVYPSFTPATAVSMGQETRRFLQDVIFSPTGKFRDLFAANYTFINATMATFYGVPAPAQEWSRVDLNPTQRQGLLTQPSILATMAKDDNTDPVRRGKFILNQFLCRSIAPPSAELVAMFKPMDLSKTARERFIEHATNPVCAVCHKYLDPLGLPFEHFDGMGKWRNDDRGMAIDVSGGVDGVAFDGVGGLANLLVTKPESQACYLTQGFMYAFGKLKADVDQEFIDYLAQKFNPDTKLTDSLVNLVRSDSFRSIRSAQ